MKYLLLILFVPFIVAPMPKLKKGTTDECRKFLTNVHVSSQSNSQNKQTLFLYRLTLSPEYSNPEKWTKETWQTIEVHSQFLSRLGKDGRLVFAGRTLFEPGNKNLFGIAVIVSESLDEAKELISNDPAVTAGIQRAEIFPFSMGIKYFENIAPE